MEGTLHRGTNRRIGEEAWMDRIVHIPEYNRYTVALLALGCSVFRLAGLLQLLELESFT